MATCFVMQPFDGSIFDRRYDEIFAPAIRDAELDPYRVDQDPKVKKSKLAFVSRKYASPK